MSPRNFSDLRFVPKFLLLLPLSGLQVYLHGMSRIQVSPEIHFGKPCVTGTRIPVHAVLELVRDGVPPETITRDYYPALKGEDIKACLQYAIDVVENEDIHVCAAS
jgi:uncharacterized protein (DUF433 family)